jgi:hypothetical protein
MAKRIIKSDEYKEKMENMEWIHLNMEQIYKTIKGLERDKEIIDKQLFTLKLELDDWKRQKVLITCKSLNEDIKKRGNTLNKK